MKVGIAGVGGIGSNVARILAQAGVAHLKIVDFDRVETGNLNRQFYRASQAGRLETECLALNLKEISPAMVVEIENAKISQDNAQALFRDCAVVVEGLDDAALKKRLVEVLAGTGQALIAASGIAGEDLDRIREQKVGNCRVVGDFTSDCSDLPLFPPKIALITARMAALVLGCIKETKDDSNR